MTIAHASNAMIISGTVAALTLLALGHLAFFPYLKRSGIAKWAFAIIVVPIGGAIGWFFYSAFAREHAKRILAEIVEAEDS